MGLIPVLSSIRHLKIVKFFFLGGGGNRFAPFSSICSVMKVSHYKYVSLLRRTQLFLKGSGIGPALGPLQTVRPRILGIV